MKITTILMCSGLLITATAFGRYTTINDASYGSESSLYEVLDIVAPVSGGWTSTAGLNTNVNGLRVSDDADQFCDSGSYKVTVLTTFWGGTAAPGDTGEQYVRYGAPDGTGSTNLTAVDEPGDTGSFQSSGTSFVIGDGGGTFGAWSIEALNSGPITDRAVTFDVSGLDVYAWTAGDKNNPVTSLLSSPFNHSKYIMAFETGSDGDYQDMLVLIEGARIVPAPGAMMLGCCGVFIVSWFRQRHFIK